MKTRLQSDREPEAVNDPDSEAFRPAPIVVAVTAHRNLLAAEKPGIERAVRRLFADLGEHYPNSPVRLLSSLAEGGDRIAANVAVDVGVELLVPLPLPVELYEQDFVDQASVDEFRALCAQGTVFELPIVEGSTRQAIETHGLARSKQYAQLGIFLSSHAQILLAIWDGKPSASLGGTAQVVDYHLTDMMPSMTSVEASAQQLLGRDENDLAFHIVCSRDQEDGSPAQTMRPLEASWLTSDADNARTSQLPEPNHRVFLQMDEFNRDMRRHWSEIAAHPCTLLDDAVPNRRRDTRITRLFRAADWLADHFQRRVNMMFRSTYTIAVGMGLAFVAYGDLPGQDYMIYFFLAFFAIGVVVYAIAQRREWHRKYLDYRALAEGLRVQLYWQVAGVFKRTETRFAHDNFLQKQEIELGWIRNVMRAASIPFDMQPTPDGGLEGVISKWIDDEGDGQLYYYRRKAAERERLHFVTRVVGMACLWSGIAVAIVLAVLGGRLTDGARDPLIVLMGVLPLIAAVREAYAHKKAEKELIKQYRFMERIFSNAKRQLSNTSSTEGRKAILRALGESALDEHAEWILMHRERPLEHSKL